MSFASGLSGFTTLFLICYVVNDSNTKSLYLRLNNDSGANYSFQRASVDNITSDASRVTNGNQIVLNTYAVLGSGVTSMYVIEINKPSAGVVARATVRGAYDATGSANTTIYEVIAAEWSNTSELINRIDLIASSNNVTTGTRILLYGSKE